MTIYLEKEQIQEALKKARMSKKPHRNYMLINTILKSGLRISELLSLRPTNILADNIHVKSLKSMNNRHRNIDVTDELIQELQMYILSNKIKPHEKIFNIKRRQAWNIIKELTGVKPHALRHTYAIRLLRATKNIKFVQKQLGHSDLKTTAIYLQFYEFEEEKSKLGEI